MKMLWKLTDNIKYEDCEVSAAPGIFAAAGSERYLPAPPPLLAASCEMRVGQTFPSAAPASPIRPKNAREKLERKDVDAAFFHFPPSKLVSHFTPPPHFFPDQFWVCLRVERRHELGFLKQLLAIRHASVHPACVSSEILGARLTRKRKPLFLFNFLSDLYYSFFY